MIPAIAQHDLEEVRSTLRIEDIVERFGIEARTDRPSARLVLCPRCGASSSSSAIVLNYQKQSWGHYGRGKREGGDCYGDALDLLAACMGLDPQREFPKVLAEAIAITGVDTSALTDEEIAARRAARERRNAERAAEATRQDELRIRNARMKAAFDWHTMVRSRRDAAGMTYLRRRGLDASALVEGDHVRFDGHGNVCVPLFDFDGEIVNVVRRKRGPGEPKCFGLDGCPTAGTLCGRIQEIAPGTNTIIAEGVIDTLTAIARWPGRVVLGAHGAGQLRAIAEAASPRVKEAGSKLVLIPDGDDIGKRQMIRAGDAAIDAGLIVDTTLLVLDLGAHHDLNEAHCAGWRPQ